MIRRYQKEVFYVALVAIAAFAIFYALSGVVQPKNQTQVSAHAWLHNEMALTDEQDRTLAVIEKKFGDKQRVLQEEIRLANKDLAAAMMEDGKFSERVSAAVERIHQAQGKLQKATIEHIFDMQTGLTPEQAKKLNKFAADALIQNP